MLAVNLAYCPDFQLPWWGKNRPHKLHLQEEKLPSSTRGGDCRATRKLQANKDSGYLQIPQCNMTLRTSKACKKILVWSEFSGSPPRWTSTHQIVYDPPLVLLRASSCPRPPTLSRSWQITAPQEYANEGPISAARAQCPVRQAKILMAKTVGRFLCIIGAWLHSFDENLMAAYITKILRLSPMKKTVRSTILLDGWTKT